MIPVDYYPSCLEIPYYLPNITQELKVIFLVRWLLRLHKNPPLAHFCSNLLLDPSLESVVFYRVGGVRFRFTLVVVWEFFRLIFRRSP